MQDIRTQLHKLVQNETDVQLLFNIYLVLYMDQTGVNLMDTKEDKPKYLN